MVVEHDSLAFVDHAIYKKLGLSHDKPFLFGEI